MNPSPSLLDKFPRPRVSAAREVIDGHTMIATATGKLISFWREADDDSASAVAERALALADGTRSIRDIASRVSAEFQVSAGRAEQDLCAFFLELEKAQAFDLREAPSNPDL